MTACLALRPRQTGGGLAGRTRLSPLRPALGRARATTAASPSSTFGSSTRRLRPSSAPPTVQRTRHCCEDRLSLRRTPRSALDAAQRSSARTPASRCGAPVPTSDEPGRGASSRAPRLTTGIDGPAFGDPRALSWCIFPASNRPDVLPRWQLDRARSGEDGTDAEAVWTPELRLLLGRDGGRRPGRRGRRLAAVRRALGEHDRRSRRVPVTRDSLARASAAEARSIAEPWSTLVDRAANMLSRAPHGTAEKRLSQRWLASRERPAHRAASGFGSVAAAGRKKPDRSER